MVSKSRSKTVYAPPFKLNGSEQTPLSYDSLWKSESMVDSSSKGSPLTEVDSVDSFLRDPTNHHDFTAALRQSSRTVGDAGNKSFRVDRLVNTRTFASGSFTNPGTTVSNSVENFCLRGGEAMPSVTAFEVPTSGALDIVGQGMYLRSLPNRDQADLGTVLGEITTNPVRALVIPGQAAFRAAKRQGRFVHKRTSVLIAERHRTVRGLPLEEARAAADDYLAYIFGARPTVQSLDRLAESLTRSRLLAETVSRQGTKRIRRRRGHPQQKRVATKVWDPYTGYRTSMNNYVVLRGLANAFVEATQDQWFSAAYRMSVPETDDWISRCSTLFKHLDKITGLGLDVKVAWDLIPFSFMADWFANTGDFLENRTIVADYNIVCEYGYVMCHTRHLQTFVAAGTLGAYNQLPSQTTRVSVSWSKLQETKQRSRCSSFGFNTNFDGLNSYQWGALTALGVSGAAGLLPTTRS